MSSRYIRMKKEDIERYLKNGYCLLKEDDKAIEDYDKVKLVEFDAKKIQENIRYGVHELITKIKKKDNELLLAKYCEKYHITPEDILRRFELENAKEDGFDYDDIYAWSYSVNIEGIISPDLSEKSLQDYTDVTDYLFENNDHLVRHCIRRIRSMDSDKPQKEWEKLNSFLKDVIEQNKLPRNLRKYKDSTLSEFVLAMQSASYFDIETDMDFKSFYCKNVESLANKGDCACMRLLGYNYYEGDGGFPLDPKLSLYWLEKAYNVSQDPEIARTIGYIYYYGRTTNGIPQGDKAFQYFAIGHFAGGYFEATYKLADCYLKGYGTPINQQAAFNLVSSIYGETRTYYLLGDDNKFADVALRLGSYYKGGVFVEKDLAKAQTYLLEARDAIKTRLSHFDYVGDKSVALGISKTLSAVENEIGIKDRVIVGKGYDLPDTKEGFANLSIKLKMPEEGVIEIIIKTKKEDTKYMFSLWECISYCERAESMKIILKGVFLTKEEFETAFNKKWNTIEFYGREVYFYGNEDSWAMTRAEHIIFIPKKIKKLGKDYKIATVEFYPDSKQYDYYCDFDAEVGNEVFVYSNGEKKMVRVVSVRDVYEDQLPLPLDKFSKIFRR